MIDFHHMSDQQFLAYLREHSKKLWIEGRQGIDRDIFSAMFVRLEDKIEAEIIRKHFNLDRNRDKE